MMEFANNVLGPIVCIGGLILLTGAILAVGAYAFIMMIAEDLGRRIN